MHNTLVVVYSNTGTSLLLARRMCAEHGWAMGRIREAKVRTGARGVLRCVADSLLRRKPDIQYEGPDPKEFDAVVLMSPIWAFRLAGPMRSFVASESSHLGHYAVVSVMGGRGAANAAAEIDRLTGRSAVLSVAFTAREVEDGSYVSRLPGVVSAIDGAQVAGTSRPAELSPQAA